MFRKYSLYGLIVGIKIIKIKMLNPKFKKKIPLKKKKEFFSIRIKLLHFNDFKIIKEQTVKLWIRLHNNSRER